jgi:acyl-CoA thioesterase I
VTRSWFDDRRLVCLIALIVTAMALLVACGGKRVALPKLDAQAVVLAFGDSLTFGTGAGPAESYPVQLSRAIQRKVVASGAPGEISAVGLARLEAVLEEFNPALLLLCHGGNDFLQKRDEAVLANNLRAMIQAAQARNIAVVLIGVPKPGLMLSTAAIYETIAKEMKIPVEGKVLADVLSDNRLKADPAHPNAQGYAKMAAAIAKLLKEHGAI